MTREWSHYQLDFFKALEELAAAPSGAIVLDAKAGSGKTSTSVEGNSRLPRTMRVLALAFNKHIQEEFRARMPAHVEVATLNGFGWRALRSARRYVQLDENKTFNVLDRLITDDRQRKSWSGSIKKIIGLKKASLRRVDGKLVTDSVNDILKLHDIEVPEDPKFMEVAAQAWKDVIAMRGVADFDDQVFQVVQSDLAVPTYDLVFVDECQDLNPVQIELVRKCAPRIVAVGDPNQAIYGFRGAAPDAVDKLVAATGARVMPLSICYRCPRAVVREAQAIVPTIEWAPNAPEGVVDTIDYVDLRTQVKAGDWVLCRTTAPLVRTCMKFLVDGIKASVKGRDIGDQIVMLIDKVNRGSDGTPIEDFVARLQNWYSIEQRRLEAAQRDEQLQALEDRVETIHALAEGARTVGDVKARIANVFRDAASPGVNFATAHRSKGLEADNVFILRPDLMPFPKAKQEWQLKQEMNLRYVAITRAMKRLAWVRKDPKEK
jgi:DNA helicase II / ATP-dependent DNA helicase PcrA